MNLRERLRLLNAAGAVRAKERQELPEAPRPAMAPSPAMLGAGLEGLVVSTDYGEAFYVENRYPVEYCRGPLPLEHMLAVPGGAWALLGRIPSTVQMRSAVFLDTETTGLAGGSGTYAFLVGLGFFSGYEFIVRQYFLRDYHEEEALLAAVARDVAPCSVLVSFNGKSFDLPLLETRYRLARRQPPLQGVPHLDLLHPSRRIFKGRLQACNLTNLEARVLGVQRYGDVPGHLIPELYFTYLRTGDAKPLLDVILHNRLDILSLVSLGGWLGQMVTDPLGPTPDGELICGDDLFAVGRLLEARGDLASALTCYETAYARGVEAVGPAQALRELSQAYKRIKAHERALAIWQEMIERGESLSLYPYLELAKYYEHTARNHKLAYEMANRALAVADRRRALRGLQDATAARERQDLLHRLARLQRKQGR